MKFIMSGDDTEVSGRSYAQVVTAMASEKMMTPKSRKSYRISTAKRVFGIYGYIVATENDKEFVKSLVEAALLIPIK